VRLTLGDAVLARRGVRVRAEHSGVFSNELIFPTQELGPVSTGRTWISLDVAVRGARFRFVDTHLEAYSPAFRLDQARELLRGPLGSSRPTVLVGDLNSGPALSNSYVTGRERTRGGLVPSDHGGVASLLRMKL
jgi:endonuclease/exonuclease/phosphatase family metal-dependent hydrolase